MSKATRLKELKQRFADTMNLVSALSNIPIGKLSRDNYVRVSVDFEVEGRLNKEELVEVGGYQSAKRELLKTVHNLPKPKILLLDIETLSIIADVWKLFDNNVGLNQIHQDWSILSWAAKWYGTPKNVKHVMYADVRDEEDKYNDKNILEPLHKLLDEADWICAHAAQRFDKKKIQARFLIHGMKPTSSFKTYDTLIVAKKHFALTSNKLEYLASKLCTNFKKYTNRKFNGHDLWRECYKGNMDAFRDMQKYNILDVLALEEVFEKLLPWENSIGMDLYHNQLTTTCICGSTEFEEVGTYSTSVGVYKKYQCVKCGAEVRDRENLLDKAKRKSIKVKTPR